MNNHKNLKSVSKFGIILYCRIANGVGDFVHLRELYKIIKRKFPNLSIGIEIFIEAQMNRSKKLVNRKFLEKLIQKFYDENIHELIYFKVTGEKFNSQKYQHLNKLSKKLKKNINLKNYIIKKINISSDIHNWLKKKNTVINNKNSLVEYGVIGKGMGLLNSGIRLYSGENKYWDNKKTEAFKTMGIIKSNNNITTWRNFSEKNGRQVTTLQMSDEIGRLDINNILMLLSERLHCTNVLDIFKNKIFEEGKEYHNNLQRLLNNVYGEVKIIYDDFSYNKINKEYEVLLFQYNVNKNTKFVFFWNNTKFIDNDLEFMAFSNYPISSIVAGDDSLSQSFSLSIDFPFLPVKIGNSTHGKHIEYLINLISPIQLKKDFDNILKGVKERLQNSKNLELLNSYIVRLKGLIKSKFIDNKGNTFFHLLWHILWNLENIENQKKIDFILKVVNNFEQSPNYNIFTKNKFGNSAYELFRNLLTEDKMEYYDNLNYDYYKKLKGRNLVTQLKILFEWLNIIFINKDLNNYIKIKKKYWNEFFYERLIDEWRYLREFVIKNKNISNKIVNIINPLFKNHNQFQPVINLNSGSTFTNAFVERLKNRGKKENMNSSNNINPNNVTIPNWFNNGLF